MPVRFLTDFDPQVGRCVEVEPFLRRIVAPNPNMYTGWGTGTYVLGRGRVAVIDPGPDDPSHVAAILDAVRGEEISHVLVTHTHADHSPASRAIAAATGATIVGYGPHPVGADDDAEEHGDTAFVPDTTVRDGDVVAIGDHEVDCIHTPGHISNHICYADRSTGVLFPGDHVMGWSTTVVSPPDGDMALYLENLRRLLGRDDRTYFPTHGPRIDDPRPFVAALIAHRQERDRQILAQLAGGPRTIAELVEVLYAEVRPELHVPAARSVQAHLIALCGHGEVALDGEGDSQEGQRYRLR